MKMEHHFFFEIFKDELVVYQKIQIVNKAQGFIYRRMFRVKVIFLLVLRFPADYKILLQMRGCPK